MRCPACDYALWNLTSRVCPECGRPFAPSEFDFIANSVRFCCPHCGQDYYGTGPRGHLVPREFDCARCHRHIDMDQMVLLPTQGVKEEQTQVDQVPWLVRAKVGLIRAWFSTVWRVMFEPGRLARATPEGSSVGQAWQFSFVSNIGYLVFGVGPILLFPLAAMLTVPAGRGGGLFLLLGAGLVVLVGLAFIGALFPVWGLVAHAILRITGRTNLGPAASVRTLCYASGANVCAAVPCLGMYLSVPGALWTGISAAAMFRVIHGVGWFRALVAGLFLPVASYLLIFGWFFLVLVPGIRTVVATAGAAARQMPASRVSAALAAYRARHNGQFPPHAIALMREGDLVGSDFTTLTWGAAPAQADPVLTSFQVLTADQQAAVAQRLAAAMPRNVIAHRLGDVVFTYHGIDPAAGDPGLWVAVEEPEAVAPSPATQDSSFEVVRPPQGDGGVGVVTLGGATLRIPRSQFAQALAAQNRLRAPLPPLPDPATVRAGAPATGP